MHIYNEYARIILDENFRRFVLIVRDGRTIYEMEAGTNSIQLPVVLTPPLHSRIPLDLIRFMDDDVFAAADCAIADPCATILSPLALRAVLTPHNEFLNELKEAVLDQIHSLPCIFVIKAARRKIIPPIRLIISILWIYLDLTGLPPAVLHLRCGAMVVLLRSVDYEGGLYNGMRAIIIIISPCVIDILLLMAHYRGRATHILPRISMSPSDFILPFRLVRRQFPNSTCLDHSYPGQIKARGSDWAIHISAYF